MNFAKDQGTRLFQLPERFIEGAQLVNVTDVKGHIDDN